MPTQDVHFLPAGSTVGAESMLDDNIAFAMMADALAPWQAAIPRAIRLEYLLPYAVYQEARVNWRPLFFAKYWPLVAEAQTMSEAVEALIAPNAFLEWSALAWPDRPKLANQSSYTVQWSSCTAPPVTDPLSFVAFGYGSCTAWASTLSAAMRAVGIPARPVGTPCWNSEFSGINYRGLASDNPNVTLCWHGGINGSATVGEAGGKYLNNHNWVEYWSADAPPGATSPDNRWVFQNVPPGSTTPNSPSLCESYTPAHGCGWSEASGCAAADGGPALAMQDHEIFAYTWAEAGSDAGLAGGHVLAAESLALSTGEPVSPLVWSPSLRSPGGLDQSRMGFSLVNRTDTYRCRE